MFNLDPSGLGCFFPFSFSRTGNYAKTLCDHFTPLGSECVSGPAFGREEKNGSNFNWEYFQRRAELVQGAGYPGHRAREERKRVWFEDKNEEVTSLDHGLLSYLLASM